MLNGAPVLLQKKYRGRRRGFHERVPAKLEREFVEEKECERDRGLKAGVYNVASTTRAVSGPEGACAGGLVHQPVLLRAKSRETRCLQGRMGGDAGGAEDQAASPGDEYEEGEHAVPEEENQIPGVEASGRNGGE